MEGLVREFTEYLCVEKRHSPHTVDGYRRDIERFVSFRSGVPLKSVTPADIREFLLSQHQKGLSSRSIARALSSLKRVKSVRITPAYRLVHSIFL